MKKIIYGLMIAVLLMGCVQKQLVQKKNVKLIVASDIHYFLKDYYQDCEWFEESMLYGDGKMVTYADEIIDAFIKAVKHEKPDLVILTGDLTFNGEKGSHEGLAKKLSEIKAAGINVAVLPGNHDIDNFQSKGYGKDDYFDVDNIDAKTFQTIYKDLGYNIAMRQHDKSLSYRIDINDDYSLLMMDSTSHNLTTGAPIDIGGMFTDSTMTWLNQQLNDISQQKKIPIVAMHHNLTHHNELLNQGYTIRDYQKIADLFESHHVPFVLSGHIHCQNIKKINDIYDIASSSLLDAPLQYGIIELNQQNMTYHTQSLQISKDANAYFDDVSSHHFEESFQVIKDETIRQQMKEVVVKANRYYFTGNIYQHIDELKNMEGYAYYFKEEGEKLKFYRDYLESMMSDVDNHQNLSISF